MTSTLARGICGLAVLTTMLSSSSAFAQEPAAARSPLTALAAREVARVASNTSTARTLASTASAAPRRASWVARHPILTGALVGAAVGTGIAGAALGNEGAFVGFYAGAAAGAAVVAIARR